jgi:hypothetical protein
MYLTKGHNSLTKLWMCICGRFAIRSIIWLWIRIFTSSRNFIIFLHFQKINTPEIKHHVGEDHSRSIQPYHSSQQLRFGSCLLLPTRFKLKV